MSQDAPLVTDEVRTQIGKATEWWTYPEPAERGSIRRFAEAIHADILFHTGVH